jgi:hypothetical protein
VVVTLSILSDYWIKKNVLHFTDEEIEEIQEQIDKQPDFNAGEDF